MLYSNSYRTDNAYETNNEKTHKVAHAGLYGGGEHNQKIFEEYKNNINKRTVCTGEMLFFL